MTIDIFEVITIVVYTCYLQDAAVTKNRIKWNISMKCIKWNTYTAFTAQLTCILELHLAIGWNESYHNEK